jgi:hypothetical protein
MFVHHPIPSYLGLTACCLYLFSNDPSVCLSVHLIKQVDWTIRQVCPIWKLQVRHTGAIWNLRNMCNSSVAGCAVWFCILHQSVHSLCSWSQSALSWSRSQDQTSGVTLRQEHSSKTNHTLGKAHNSVEYKPVSFVLEVLSITLRLWPLSVHWRILWQL